MEADGSKLGLALSGGGFRASFFHIGVLARLAELGVLRRVEVISTVSGGSIVGALWYLHAKKLLEQDADPSPQRYVEEVQALEDEFLEATRRNIRGRVFLNLAKNFYMARLSYSRSDRIGDLYDRYFYKPAWPGERPKRYRLIDKQIEMRELLIQPAGVSEPFDPDVHNAGREAKVPILLLNATSLNTGHNWRFEAVRMGEPMPADDAMREVMSDVDKNELLGQGYYGELGKPAGQKPIAEKQRDFPLGLAVAASACVPGLFHPLSISGMYRDGRRVQLVDGGVHDNQGVQGLFDRGCTHLIVSDASGQMQEQTQPGARVLSVLGRSTSIYGARLRNEQLVRASREGAAAGHGLRLMHLRAGLGRHVEPPLAEGDEYAYAPSEQAPHVGAEAFGVAKQVQSLLARVRTDLDLFGDSEAFTLSLDGYRMTGAFFPGDGEFAQFVPDAPPGEDPARWQFSGVSDLVGPQAARPGWYTRALRAGSKRFLKPLFLSWFLCGAIAALVGVGIWQLVANWADVTSSLSARPKLWWTLLPLLLLVLYVADKVRMVLVRWPSQLLVSIALPFIFAPLLWLFALVSLPEGWLYRRLARVRPPPR
ncbi:MAG TPA: patatin-like phospholipase family protein [Thermoleophilaceae bacterium]